MALHSSDQQISHLFCFAIVFLACSGASPLQAGDKPPAKKLDLKTDYQYVPTVYQARQITLSLTANEKGWAGQLVLDTNAWGFDAFGEFTGAKDAADVAVVDVVLVPRATADKQKKGRILYDITMKDDRVKLNATLQLATSAKGKGPYRLIVLPKKDFPRVLPLR